ncbi:MAG: hypothetical protein WCB27_11740 [Thermoguttaceae bacterium]
MQAVVSVKLTETGELLPAILSTERAESSYGQPVVVIDGEENARGPAEVEAIRVSPTLDADEVAAARQAGFRVIVGNEGSAKS